MSGSRGVSQPEFPKYQYLIWEEIPPDALIPRNLEETQPAMYYRFLSAVAESMALYVGRRPIGELGTGLSDIQRRLTTDLNGREPDLMGWFRAVQEALNKIVRAKECAAGSTMQSENSHFWDDMELEWNRCRNAVSEFQARQPAEATEGQKGDAVDARADGTTRQDEAQYRMTKAAMWVNFLGDPDLRKVAARVPLELLQLFLFSLPFVIVLETLRFLHWDSLRGQHRFAQARSISIWWRQSIRYALAIIFALYVWKGRGWIRRLLKLLEPPVDTRAGPRKDEIEEGEQQQQRRLERQKRSGEADRGRSRIPRPSSRLPERQPSPLVREASILGREGSLLLHRVRGMTASEASQVQDHIPFHISLDHHTLAQQGATSGQPMFESDFIFSSAASNGDICDKIQRPIAAFVQGKQHLCLIVDGFSGTGKSVTLFERDDSIAPTIAKRLFEHANSETPVQVSAIEIMAKTRWNQLISPVVVQSADALVGRLRQCVNKRKTASTADNAKSSRTHLIVRLSRPSAAAADAFLVDLAGAEEKPDESLAETQEIRSSRNFLRTEIKHWLEGSFVSQNDELTKRLSPFFKIQQSAKLVLIMHLSPLREHEGQNTKTLEYGDSIRKHSGKSA